MLRSSHFKDVFQLEW